MVLEQFEETSLDRLLHPLVRVLIFFAAWSLSAMMFLDFADVFLRYLFNSPIPGATEIIQYLMSIVVPFSIVFCAYQRQHISVDLLVENLPKKVLGVIECIIRLVMVGLFVLITWQTFAYTLDEYQSKLTSAVLYIPVYPFIAIMAIAFLSLTLLLVIQFISNVLKVVSQWTHL